MSAPVFLDAENNRSSRNAEACRTCCGAPLTLHQPDLELPDRLLGTCEQCKSWYVLIGATSLLISTTDYDAARARVRKPRRKPVEVA